MKYIGLIFMILTFCSCRQYKSTDENIISTMGKDTQNKFVLPEIPVMIISTNQKAEFLVSRYWDNLQIDSLASSLNYGEYEMEQAWVDYCSLLNSVSIGFAQPAIKGAFSRFSRNKMMFKFFVELADKYLYDPNSPLRNEELYIPVLEVMLNSSLLSDNEKIAPKARFDLAQKNRLGSKATNFVYTLKSGKQGTLYAIPTDFTILFINNPGCHACEITINELKSSELIANLLGEGKLAILALYTDEDLSEWSRHLSDFPQEWINGYDKKQIINKKQLYDLKAIPTLYLLDKNKKVLLKDTPFTVIEEYFIQNTIS